MTPPPPTAGKEFRDQQPARVGPDGHAGGGGARVPDGQPWLAHPRLPDRHGGRGRRHPGRAVRGGPARAGERRGRARLGGPDHRAGPAAGVVARLLHRLRDPVAGADPGQGGPGAAGGHQGGGAGPVPARGHPGAAGAGRLPGPRRLPGGRVHPVHQGQPAARGPGRRDPGAARAQRPGRPGAGQLHAPAGAGALHRHPRPERGRQRGVPGGADVPAAGAQPVARSPLGAGPAAGQPAGGPAAPAATGRGLPRALPPVRGRRLPAAPAPGRRARVGLWTTPSAPFPGRLRPPPGGRARSRVGGGRPGDPARGPEAARERAGEGAGPSPVEQGGFAPPG